MEKGGGMNRLREGRKVHREKVVKGEITSYGDCGGSRTSETESRGS